MKRVIFFGTPQPSQEVLSFLFHSGEIEVVAVVTNPDRIVGRKKIMTPSPVKSFAIEKGLPVYTPEEFSHNEQKKLEKYSADFFIIVAYGKLIPQNIIDIPKNGTFNLHFSLLPKYRGASPVQSALLSGDEFSGISIFQLVEKMDAGDIFIQKKTSLFENHKQKNYVEVWNEMIEIGKKELCNLIQFFQRYSPSSQKTEDATFCGKFTKSDGEVFIKKNTALDIIKKYNAFFLWPGIFFFDDNNKRVQLLEISLADSDISHQTGISDEENSRRAGEFFYHDKKLFLQTSMGILEIIKIQKEGRKPLFGDALGHFI